MDNLPSISNNGFTEISVVSNDNLGFNPDPGYDYEDVKCSFDPQIPFYEKTDYIVAAASGLLTAALDIILVKETSLEDAHKWGDEKIGSFVTKVARKIGYKGNELKGAVEFLEGKYPLAGDRVTSSFGGTTQHHLRDFSHHPTIVGLFFSLLTQFTGKVYGTNTAGVFVSVKVPEGSFIGRNATEKMLYGTVYWLFHMISDMAGSSGSIGRRSGGTGIPGPFLSFMKEVSALPFFQSDKDGKNINMFSLWLSKLFNGTSNKDGVRIDLRTELGLLYNQLKHSFAIMVNEFIVRGYFMVSRICVELSNKKIKSASQLDQIDIGRIIPIKQRKLTRMLTISSGTFFGLTTGYTVVKGVVTDNYADIFINLNYAGIFRFAVACKSDYRYIVEDTVAFIEKFKEREAQRNKYFAEQNLGVSYFTLNSVQGAFLDSLKDQKIMYDIKKTKDKKIDVKKSWHDQWIKKTQEISKERIIKDEPLLYVELRNEMKRSEDKEWIKLVAMELSRFTPYYPWGDDKEKDKKLKFVKLQSDYENDVFTVMQNYVDKSEYKRLCDSIKHYENVLNGTTKKIVTGVATTLVVTVVSGGIAFAAAPTIAVSIAGGSFSGLSGAALTNASLAAIGGGSLAAGGMGMSGGTAIITGGGALLSFLGSGGASVTSMNFLASKGNVITECANILTYCSLVLPEGEKRTKALKEIGDYLKNSKNECENDIAMMKASPSKEKDTKLIRAAEGNLKYIKTTIKEIEKLSK